MPTHSPSAFTVMIVEDHPDQRALLGIILQKEGYRVVSTENGLQAWEKLQKDDTQLILLDIMLPKMNGLDLLRRIRGDDRLKHICAIFVTARNKESDIVNGLDSGADDYITKPYSFPELLARIRARVRRMTRNPF
jgi:DNA-binding response OmpR family regulator